MSTSHLFLSLFLTDTHMYVKLQARLKGQRMYERSLTVKAAFPQLGEVGGWWEKEIHDSFASNIIYSLRSHEIQSTYKLSKMIYENRQQVQNDRTMYRSLSSLHTLKSEQNSHEWRPELVSDNKSFVSVLPPSARASQHTQRATRGNLRKRKIAIIEGFMPHGYP